MVVHFFYFRFLSRLIIDCTISLQQINYKMVKTISRGKMNLDILRKVSVDLCKNVSRLIYKTVSYKCMSKVQMKIHATTHGPSIHHQCNKCISTNSNHPMSNPLSSTCFNEFSSDNQINPL